MHWLSISIFFTKSTDHDEKESKRFDLTLLKFVKVKKELNGNRMKLLDFNNKRLFQKINTRVCLKEAREAMLEYYRAFAK